jgi:hypothetical protein
VPHNFGVIGELGYLAKHGEKSKEDEVTANYVFLISDVQILYLG